MSACLRGSERLCVTQPGPPPDAGPQSGLWRKGSKEDASRIQDAQGTMVKERRKAYCMSCREEVRLRRAGWARRYGLHAWMGREQHMSFPG